MMTPAHGTESERVWRWPLLAACLILVSAGLRFAYLASNCPLDLAPDEAHYWDWSRHPLEWSYYSKGPLVAYLIRVSCLLAGSLSQQLTRTDMLAVRLPAVLCGSLVLVSLYLLTVQVFRRAALGTLVVAVALTLPALAAGSCLMTIDAPFTCCWSWALVLGHRAVFRGSAWAWPATGLVVALGILAKYTMVLWLLSAGLFLLASPVYRQLLFRPGFWVMSAVAALGGLPILAWNMQHDWVTFHHVNALAAINQGSRWIWYGPLAYVGGQCVLLLVLWFGAWLAAMIAHGPWRERDEGIRYLWWLSAPTFVVFLLFSPRTGGGELNWPVTAYFSGIVLTVAWLVRQLQAPQRWYVWLTATGMATATVVGLVLTGLVHHSEIAYPVFARLSRTPTGQDLLPVRRWDPTCRLRGWRTLAAEVDRIRGELRGQGIEPVLACESWILPGELGFYCSGHPIAYSVGPALGERHSQYDLWPNPLADRDQFQGRTFIYVGYHIPQLYEAFDEVSCPPRRVMHIVRGQPIGFWEVSICRGYRGFSAHARQKY
jgi:4-amino-4-deoxy-L-arabinose transferase-like glycosyltransferase